VDITSDKSSVNGKDGCSIPTLVIGKKNIIDIVGEDNVHYLDKKVANNLYWTFAKTEQRNEYERDLESFNKLLLDKLLYGVEYRYVNIFQRSLSDLKKFITFMCSPLDKAIYVSRDMMYIYCKKVVYGVSLTDLNYVGITTEKVLKKIYKQRHNRVIYNDYFLKKSLRKQLNMSKILVPYLFFLQNS
jgi:hypothetical protein